MAEYIEHGELEQMFCRVCKVKGEHCLQCVIHQALNRAKKNPDVVEVGKAAKIIADIFGSPCNFSPIDEEMFDYCGDDCQNDEYVCWARVIKSKLSKENNDG